MQWLLFTAESANQQRSREAGFHAGIILFSGIGAIIRGAMPDYRRILVVEDDRAISRGLEFGLKQEGFDVTLAETGKAALEAARTLPIHLVLLDVRLPDTTGFDVCRRLRAEGKRQPILMVTARDEELDKVVGLELGADDYIVKPFSPKELVARVRAVLRRAEARREAPAAQTVRAADLTLDLPKMTVSVDGRPAQLTASEFQLLAALAQQPGRVFTRAQLLDALRGVAFESYERAIDAHIKNIRRKIEPDPRAPRYILTVYGVGYKFAEA